MGGRFSDDGAAGVFGGYRGSDPEPQRNELFQGACRAVTLGLPSIAAPHLERSGTRIGAEAWRNPDSASGAP